MAEAGSVNVAEVRRRELAAFLRGRRERITPEQVGLAPGGRRRTPGLRREEVAQLTGVGVTWYTWLEQARDIRVSDQVLTAIARTLQFDPHERAHLFTLAGIATTHDVNDSPELPPRVERMLEQLDPYPASVINARLDVLAYNRTYSRLLDDLDAMPYDERNGLWLTFTNPRWQEALVDLEDARSAMVGHFRAAMAEHVGDPTWKCFLKRLQQASPEFVSAWDRYEVRVPENRTKRIMNPLVGLLQLDYTNLWFGQRLGTRLVTYTPADEAAEQRLQELYDIVTAGPSLALA